MMKYHSISLGLFLLVTIVECQFYRYDYDYIEKVHGWMKYHRVPDTFRMAVMRCNAEGAILASPTDSINRNAMMTVKKANSDCPEEGLLTGIHAIFSNGDYTTASGIPLDKMTVAWAPGHPVYSPENGQCTAMLENGTLVNVLCSEAFPYICYRRRISDESLEPCGTVDKLYSLDKRTGSCYKFHRVGLTWRLAYMTCLAEGGYLAIINDAFESDVIKKIFTKYPNDTIVGLPYKHVAAVGIVDIGDRSWFTIHGQSLSQVFSKFNPEQPDPRNSMKCGAVFRNGLLDNIGCSVNTMPFICEKHPDSLKSKLKIIGH